jgi:T5SS/PEP-CTERM-associated repeat protein
LNPFEKSDGESLNMYKMTLSSTARLGRRRMFWAALFTAFATLPAVPAKADTTWIVDTGAWLNPGNWSGGVPTATTNAFINNGGTAQIFQTGTQALDIHVGGNVGNVGTLQVSGVGNVPADLTIASSMVVGGFGNGTLSISGRATVNAQSLAVEFGFGDSTASSSGTVTLLSATAHLNLSNDVTIGGTGDGLATCRHFRGRR